MLDTRIRNNLNSLIEEKIKERKLTLTRIQEDQEILKELDLTIKAWKDLVDILEKES